MASQPKLGAPPLREEPTRAFSVVVLAVLAFGLAYLASLIFTPLFETYRAPIPYAVPIFDTPFVLVAIGVAYLCLERHRLRQDGRSAFLGASLWLAGLLGLAHILTQPDYPGTPTIHAGVAPYFFLLSCVVGFVGIALAAHSGERRLPLSDRARYGIGGALLLLGVLVVITVMQLRPLLPSLVMPPGRLTPFAIGVAGVCCGLPAVWGLWGGAQKVLGRTQDWFAGYLVLAALIWLFGLLGFLIFPFRYGLTWYMAGLTRPIGVGVVFVGLLWEQVWLYQQARARQRDLEVLHTAGQALVTSLDPQQIVEAIASKAREVSGAAGAVLFRLDAQTQILQAVRVAGEISQDLVSVLQLPVGEGAAGLAVAERRPVWSSNLSVDGRIQVPSEIRQRLGREGFKAVLVIPLLIKGGEVFGALTVAYKEEREFTDADIELLLAFGTQVSVAIENARSFDQLTLKAWHDRALQAFGQRLLEATGEETILNATVGVTEGLLKAEYVGLFLFDPGAGRLHLKAGVGWGPGNVGVITVPPSAESLVGYAFLKRESVQVEDLSREHRFSTPSWLVAHGVQAGLFVPFGVGDRPAGVIGVCHRMPHRFSEEETRVLMSIVHQAALALEKVHLYGELHANLERLQETQDQLIQADKLKALGTLLSGMAHELNNPLSSVLLATQRLKQEYGLPPRAEQRLAMIEQQAERASRIVKDLVAFARRKPPERQRVDVNEVVKAALTLQAPDFDLNNIRVIRHLAPGLPEIWADGPQLQQVFLNLFTNATYAMKSGDGRGTLTVRSFCHGSEVWVETDDDGPGIPPDHLGRIFDPFFTTKAAGEGTGLGLSFSFGIVEAHGGQMQAENVRGSGARFTVRLPIQDAAERVERRSAESVVAGGRRHLLIVDDEKDFRELLAELFSDLGHQVEEAATGQEAISRLERQGYDLVALDLRLPDLDATEVWRWIVSERPALASRVVFMTGDIMSLETEQFVHETGRSLLVKPLTTEQVRRTINEVLTQNSSYAS